MRLKISKIRSAKEPRPIERLTARRTQYTGERIRMDSAVLAHERCGEERAGNGFATSEGWLGAELLQHELLDGIVEDSVSHADAGLSWSPGQLGQPAVAGARAPVKADAWRKSFVVCLSQSIGYTLVSGKNQPQWRYSCSVVAGNSRIDGGRLSRPECLYLLSGIGEWRIQFPAHTIIQRYVWLDLPAVLREQVDRFGA